MADSIAGEAIEVDGGLGMREVGPVSRHELLRILRATPDRVVDLARGLSPNQLARRPSEGEWKRMLFEEAAVFPSSASSRTGLGAEPTAHDFHAHLAAFRRVREETLAFLEALNDSDWRRTGTTPIRGTLTIQAYAHYLAEHDLEHLAQLESTHAAGER
ncbi:MAG: DinB family protein [Candidatus Methylomirabilia bacterium]